MSSFPPFEIDAAAIEYLKARQVPDGSEAGITYADHYEMRDAEGNLTDRYDSGHFVIGYAKPGHWSGIRVPVGHNQFWVPEPTVAKLVGKMLTLLKRYDGAKQPGKVQNLLVAM
jgi:hypothetical protein